MAGLTRTGMLGYVAFAIPMTGLSAGIVNLVPAYYAEVLGLSLSSVGFVFFLLRLFDAVTDPAMGWLLDRHPFERQHKPWLLLSLPIFLLSIVLLFRPLPSLVGIPYLMLAGFLAYGAYTVGLVTHQAWGADLARDPRALSALMGYRELAVIGGILGVFLAPAIAEGLGFEGIEPKVIAASIYLFAGFALFGPLCLFFAPDEPSPEKARPAGLAEAKRFLTGSEFLLLSLANLATSFSLVSLSVISYFLAAYVFGSSERYGIGMTLYFVMAALGMPIWMRIARHLGDRRTLVVSLAYVVSILALTPIWADFTFEWRYPAFVGLLGLGFGAPPYLVRAMIGHLANEYEERTGQGVRGTAYAVTTFFDKLGSGSAAGIVLPLIGWLGFEAETGGGEVGRVALIWVGTLAPITGFVIAGLATAFVLRAHRARPA